MLRFYWISFAVMVLLSLRLHQLKRSVSALCGIVILSYLSFFFLYYTDYTDNFYRALDTIRIAFIMTLILYCGFKSSHPKTYLIYSLILLFNIAVNIVWIFSINFYLYADHFYLIIAIAELIIFSMGVNRTLKLNSRLKNGITHINCGGYLDIVRCRDSRSDKTISEGSTE